MPPSFENCSAEAWTIPATLPRLRVIQRSSTSSTRPRSLAECILPIPIAHGLQSLKLGEPRSVTHLSLCNYPNDEERRCVILPICHRSAPARRHK